MVVIDPSRVFYFLFVERQQVLVRTSGPCFPGGSEHPCGQPLPTTITGPGPLITSRSHRFIVLIRSADPSATPSRNASATTCALM